MTRREAIGAALAALEWTRDLRTDPRAGDKIYGSMQSSSDICSWRVEVIAVGNGRVVLDSYLPDGSQKRREEPLAAWPGLWDNSLPFIRRVELA